LALLSEIAIGCQLFLTADAAMPANARLISGKRQPIFQLANATTV